MENENTENEVAEREEGYKRRLLDSRIDKYLDEHFDEYIEDYGLVTEQHLKACEKKATELEERVSNLLRYTKDVDAAVADFERRVTTIEKAVPKPAPQMATPKQGSK